MEDRMDTTASIRTDKTLNMLLHSRPCLACETLLMNAEEADTISQVALLPCIGPNASFAITLPVRWLSYWFGESQLQ